MTKSAQYRRSLEHLLELAHEAREKGESGFHHLVIGYIEEEFKAEAEAEAARRKVNEIRRRIRAGQCARAISPEALCSFPLDHEGPCEGNGAEYQRKVAETNRRLFERGRALVEAGRHA